ncbi:hypothetical protein, partial [Mesorhizobium sp. P5_C1]
IRPDGRLHAVRPALAHRRLLASANAFGKVGRPPRLARRLLVLPDHASRRLLAFVQAQRDAGIGS